MKIANRFVKQLAVISSFGMASLLASPSAEALTASDNLTVSATVTAACTITATGAVNFGAYVPSANKDATGTLQVNCSTGSLTYVTLGQGLNPGAGSTDAAPVRQMASGADRLGYQLYQDAGRTVVWGNTQPTSVGHTGTGANVNLTVYGRIPSGQGSLSGSYSDTVVATINF